MPEELLPQFCTFKVVCKRCESWWSADYEAQTDEAYLGIVGHCDCDHPVLVVWLPEDEDTEALDAARERWGEIYD